MFMGAIVSISSLNIDAAVGRSLESSAASATLRDGSSAISGCRAARCTMAAARLGVPTVIVGRVSDNDQGRDLTTALKAEGVDCTHLRPVPDSGLDLTAEDISAAEDLVRQAAVCLLLGKMPFAAFERAVELCSQNGVETIVTAEALPAGTLPASRFRADVLCCDETETGQLTGLSVTKSPRAVAAVLGKRGCRSVVLRLGQRGAYVLSPEGESAVPGFAAQPLNATTAADVFIAALAACRAWGWSLHEAIRFANAAGSLAGARTEPLAALPVRAEVEALLLSQL